MIEDQDPLVLSLFAESEPVREDEVFTHRVLKSTYTVYRIVAAMLAIIGLLLVLGITYFDLPLQEFFLLLIKFLSSSVIDIGQNWLSFLLSPLNSFAGLLALVFKGVLIMQKRLRLFAL